MSRSSLCCSTAVAVLLLICTSVLELTVEAREITVRSLLLQQRRGYDDDGDQAGSTPTTPATPGPADACTPSTLLTGCMVSAGAGVEVHYQLIGSPVTSISFALKAQTSGYVAIGFTNGSPSMYPADAVIGWFSGAAADVKAYTIDGQSTSDITPDSSVQLYNTSATESGAATTVYFTREVAAGRFPINVTAATFNVAVGPEDALVHHTAATSYSANLQSSSSTTPTTPSPTGTPTASTAGTPASKTSGCVASSVIPGGCVVDGGAGVEVNYILVGTPPTVVTIALKAQTAGYVAMGFTSGQPAMYPADAVIGWVDDSGIANIQSYHISSYDVSGVQPDSSVQLTDTSAVESGGYTTVTFTRSLKAGRYPINIASMTFNVAQGSADRLQLHTQATAGSVDLTSGSVSLKSPRDKFWVTHGILMIAAWALFVPHAVSFARFKGKWSDVLKNDAMWFHLHRLLQFLAAIVHIISMIIALTKFGEINEDAPVSVHSAIAWIVTALLAVQWVVALFLRPGKDAPKRRLWNLFHFNAARFMLVIALANIGLGIYLYERKAGNLLLSTGAWIAIFAVALVTAIIHFVILAIRRAPAMQEVEMRASSLTNKVDNPAYPGAPHNPNVST